MHTVKVHFHGTASSISREGETVQDTTDRVLREVLQAEIKANEDCTARFHITVRETVTK